MNQIFHLVLLCLCLNPGITDSRLEDELLYPKLVAVCNDRIQEIEQQLVS